MKYIILTIPLLALALSGCCQNIKANPTAMKAKKTEGTCTDLYTDNCSEKTLSCKLTSPEMQKRKATIIARLKKQVLEKKELPNHKGVI
ncbi:hypothetical protein CPT03_07200 [Pedobacter ginsengisoli]|uniref:Lipoprotein n=1 Tax=Pedobacter ginsengisoli TaxID=363852 RepID=A0A2D1U3U3_9SPHI|nr:hypothetical protein [Pedobacter ginsengisoli]ATP56272.1 hypothetical protein CPT03_07200 [Pedobacter ginsengisoli]